MVVDEDDACAHGALLGSRSSTSVPAPGRGDRRAATGPLETAFDRVDEAAPVGGDRCTVEPGAAVADEDGQLVLGHLRVDVDLDAGELRGVRHRLAGGEDELGRDRPRRLELASSTRTP